MQNFVVCRLISVQLLTTTRVGICQFSRTISFFLSSVEFLVFEENKVLPRVIFLIYELSSILKSKISFFHSRPPQTTHLFSQSFLGPWTLWTQNSNKTTQIEGHECFNSNVFLFHILFRRFFFFFVVFVNLFCEPFVWFSSFLENENDSHLNSSLSFIYFIAFSGSIIPAVQWNI